MTIMKNVRISLTLLAYQEIFKRRPSGSINILSGQYDFQSIMHSSKYSYSVGNGKATIIDKHNPDLKLGGMKLSPLDIMNIKLFFHCSRKHEYLFFYCGHFTGSGAKLSKFQDSPSQSRFSFRLIIRSQHIILGFLRFFQSID